MNYAELKIGKLVQTVLRPLIISKATMFEVSQMQDLEYSKATFGIQYPLLLKTSSPVAEKHYYSELLTLYGESYRLCCEWFETASNNDRPYVEKWIQEHVDILPIDGVIIEPSQYKDRTDLIVVEIPKGVKYIGSAAFENCINLKEIRIPDTVRMIDMRAFENCHSLEKIKFPKALLWLGYRAFANCKSLQSVELSMGLREIPIGCFAGCENLKEITGYSCAQIIEQSAFEECKSLEFLSLDFFPGLRVIRPGAFAGCSDSFVLELGDRKVLTDKYDIVNGGYAEADSASISNTDGWLNKSMIVIEDINYSAIRTVKGAPGEILAQKLGINVEYMKID